MADENTQTAQNPVAQAVNPAPEAAAPAPEAVPAAQVAATPVPAETPAPAPAAPAAPASQGGLAGLGLNSFKLAVDSAKNAVNTAKDAAGNAVDSAKNASGQGTAGFSKLTGTLSSVGGNVMGAVTGACSCPVVNVEVWDKKKVTLHKTFYKTFSTRAFGYHLTDAIDKNRGFIEMKVKDYKPVANPMILDTNSLFWSTLLIEVEGTNPQDPKVVTLDKEFYCKVSKNKSRKDLQLEVAALEQEMGKKPTEVYFWFVTCMQCDAKKEIKTVILAA